jgi:flagellar biosynthesis/type III secretory pathway protein FliH
MPMIRRADAASLTRDAVVLDLGDLARQGQTLLERARQEAARIEAEAQAERDRLIAGASEKGHAEGLERGLAEGHAQGVERGRAEAVEAQAASLETMQRAWAGALDAFEGSRSELRAQAERDVLTLAVRIGERVAKRAVEVDEQAAVGQLTEALELTMRPSRLRVRVSPGDAQTVRAAMPGLSDRLGESASVVVVEDGGLSHGSVVVEADETLIDATIETQVGRIVDALLPGGSS